MRLFRRVFVLLVASLLALLIATPAVAADLSRAKLEPGDMPSGFRAVTREELADSSVSFREMGDNLAQEFDAGLLSYSVLVSEDGADMVESFLVGPLPSMWQTRLDFMFRNDQRAIEEMGTPSAFFIDFSAPVLLPSDELGDSAFGYETEATTGADSYIQAVITGTQANRGLLQVVMARSGEYMEVVLVLHLGAGTPPISAVEAAEILDQKVRRAQGLGGYRPAGSLVPVITTYIPTPLDISTDPAVLGANLLIAALAVIAFTVALRFLNASLAGHEGQLQKVFPPARWLATVQARIDTGVQTRVGRGTNALRLTGILLFYGIVFSLLEPGWVPWTVTGLALLIYMTVAFGAVGIVDDLAAWVQAKRWGMPVKLAVKPALALLAVSSTVITRLFGIVPGIMLGTPDAFPVEKSELDAKQEKRLVHVGTAALLITGAGAWLVSMLAELLRRADVTDLLQTPAAAVEAFVLVIFAVTVQNLFMQLISLPGSIGKELQERSMALWLAAMAATTFLFLHTLLNPEGDVAAALGSANVIVFLVTVAVFVAVAIAIWYAFRVADRRRPPDTKPFEEPPPWAAEHGERPPFVSQPTGDEPVAPRAGVGPPA